MGNNTRLIAGLSCCTKSCNSTLSHVAIAVVNVGVLLSVSAWARGKSSLSDDEDAGVMKQVNNTSIAPKTRRAVLHKLR
eukprot:CAMPEP_0172778594 /NCGR_PEP_ID=MMETSP1074-20121228/201988_1 /TAXON_ID=2916 /ORGANISM="Ceratium fusus, Strain PA161109" /LENGTH=78 /DNA_ID=CAMNT_0013615537 /DNA_START=1186 /DNA_END=1422 /DNA_ORIENTATION=-